MGATALKVDIELAKRLIGKEGWNTFERFIEAINPRDWSVFHCRFATSAISRGELQLLNTVDIPRFIIRVQLEKAGSFVNLRRLTEFGDRLKDLRWLSLAEPRWLQFENDVSTQGYQAYQPTTTPGEIFNDTLLRYSIADAVLVPPRNKKNDFHFVTAELGWPYGEGRSIEGVPFVRAMPHFGGAACAQAAAHMVSACLHDKPGLGPRGTTSINYFGMHGLAEITSIVVPKQTCALRLGELPIGQIEAYFKAIGRRPVIEAGHAAAAVDVIRSFRMVCDTYVRSGLPLQLLCRSTAAESDANHVLVIIGVPSKRPGNNPQHVSRLSSNEEFVSTVLLFNNPTGLPFQPLGEEELERVALFEDDLGAELGKERWMAAMVVLPDAVSLSLLDTFRRPANAPPIIGLLTYSEKLPVPPTAGPADYQLVFLRTRTKDNDSVFSGQDRAFLGADFCTAFNANPISTLLEGHWVWIERREHLVRLWRAEGTLPITKMNASDADISNDAKSLLICVGKRPKKGDSWQLSKSAATGLPENRSGMPCFGRVSIAEKKILEARKSLLKIQTPGKFWATRVKDRREHLVTSVITSFSPSSLEEAAQFWPKGAFYGDLYTFMHRDQELLKPLWQKLGFSGAVPPSILELLSTAETFKEPDQLAGMLTQKIYKTFSVVKEFFGFGAISTYLPQLFSTSADSQERAFKAVRFLVRLSKCLNTRYHRNPSVLELVTGSRILGVARGKKATVNGQIDPLFACREEMASKINTVVDSLDQLVRFCEFQDHESFTFAVEVEPGDLATVSSLESIELFCEGLRRAGLTRRVGLNVDIGHCVLAGIRPLSIFQNQQINQHICGFHISDHGPGHLGDLVPGDCCFNSQDRQRTDLSVFEVWIHHALNFASERKLVKGGNYPEFSGLLSLELEAVRDADDVQHGVDVLNSIIFAADR